MKFKLEDLEEAMEGYGGFCTACGEYADGLEPDAHKYRCEACGERTVYGAEQLILLGFVE